MFYCLQGQALPQDLNQYTQQCWGDRGPCSTPPLLLQPEKHVIKLPTTSLMSQNNK